MLNNERAKYLNNLEPKFDKNHLLLLVSPKGSEESFGETNRNKWF